MVGKNKEKSRIYITKKPISLKYTLQVNITYLLAFIHSPRARQTKACRFFRLFNILPPCTNYVVYLFTSSIYVACKR